MTKLQYIRLQNNSSCKERQAGKAKSKYNNLNGTRDPKWNTLSKALVISENKITPRKKDKKKNV